MKRRVGYQTEDKDESEAVQGIMKKMRLEAVEQRNKTDEMDAE